MKHGRRLESDADPIGYLTMMPPHICFMEAASAFELLCSSMAKSEKESSFCQVILFFLFPEIFDRKWEDDSQIYSTSVMLV